MSDDIVHLDPTATERLRRIGGTRLLTAMLRSFVDNARERKESAREALERGDADGVSAAAHALKSSAGNVGATDLQEVAGRVEREARLEGADLVALVDALTAASEPAERAARDLIEAESGSAGSGSG